MIRKPMEQDRNNTEGRSTLLMGEMLLFGLLGRVLYAQLDHAWLQQLIAEDVFGEAPFGMKKPEVKEGLRLLQAWSAKNRNGISQADFLNLQADYTRLFVGVGRVLAPLWESVYFNENRMVFHEQTLQVRKWFRRFNLEAEKMNAEPDDHIGLEMTFVAHLANLALKVLDQGDHEKLEEYLEAQRDFLSQHLLKWGPAWCNLVEEQAHTDFYKGLAKLTRGALHAAAEWLDIEIPREFAL
jgi:TorA maturation chaperone TorD